MKRINIDIVIKIIILLGFSCFFYSIVLSGKITDLVHPRVIPYIIIATCGMGFIIISLITFIFKASKVRRKKSKYVIFIIPLIIATTIVIKDFKKESIEYKKTEIGKKFIEGEDSNLNNEKTNFKDRIIVSDRNFINFVEESLKKYDEYKNKEIEIIGFIHKEDSYDNKEFQITRFMMTCCTSDMTKIGIKSSSVHEYEEGLWVKVIGKIYKKKNGLEEEIILKAESIEIVEPPSNQYVYPF
ncbi:TIGR03943 family putative permease subunit [Clostridium paraputrificum]|uniref:TIGR03943 family putative permease subunit n=1 Tax=Clostridium paraputrificum TaxID=29363 RepID=UPI003D358684